MSSLRLAPRARATPPPAPGSSQWRAIAAALAAGEGEATVARRLRRARAHVAHVRAALPGPTSDLAPAAPPVAVLPAPVQPAWEALSEAIARMIRRQDDEAERYHLRIAFLRARYTPWRD
ncbi:MAG TPA: hypothetical protein PKD53_16750 [Chloroflexaceae bacterium]|nr:hypothetical protein [Chloroflexaceae bacterium]